MRWLSLLVFVGAAVGLFAPNALADYIQADKELARGRLEKARALMVAPAKAGEARAQCALGRLMLNAWQRDGVKWIQSAADAGHLPAQVRLGRMYMLGFHVVRNPREAVAWLERAIAHEDEAGHAVEASYARLWLSKIYGDGLGVQAQRTKSVALLKTAADAGNERAQYEYAELLFRGKEVPKDLVEAHKYFVLSWKQDYVLNKNENWDKPLFSAKDMVLMLRKEMKAAQFEKSRAAVRTWLDAQKKGTLGRAFGKEIRRSTGRKLLVGNERGWGLLHWWLFGFSGGASKGCEKFQLTQRKRARKPGVEIWTVDRCGKRVQFQITLKTRGPKLLSYGFRLLGGNP